MYGKPSIVIVEQYSLVAEAVKKLLELELGLRVLDTFSDASLLVASFDKAQPDLILLHIYEPCTAGFEYARTLKATYPAIKMIVMTTNENPKIALDCMNSWASGYLLMKSAEELLQAVRRVVAGSKYLSPDLQRKLQEAQWRNARFQSTASLTDRQRQVLKLLNEGCTMREIAANLRITARTVAFHKYRIMAVLGAKNSIELLRFSEHQEPEPNERGSGS